MMISDLISTISFLYSNADFRVINGEAHFIVMECATCACFNGRYDFYRVSRFLLSVKGLIDLGFTKVVIHTGKMGEEITIPKEVWENIRSPYMPVHGLDSGSLNVNKWSSRCGTGPRPKFEGLPLEWIMEE